MTINRLRSTQRYSHIVVHNDTVYLAGQVADDVQADITGQTKQCLMKVETLLGEAGSSREHILSATIFLRDMADFSAMNLVWDEWVSAIGKPTRACVEARMASPDILVEICIIAAVA